VNSSYENRFSHIYVESAARDYPLAQTVLSRFPKAKTVTIGRYKSVFNRSNQSFRAQKLSPKLILAVKPDSFLYERPAFSQDFGQSRFYYNTLLLNCIYDCEYCYLQGMFPGAHMVAFVNTEDFFTATDAALNAGPLQLAISYDTDLLAFENVIPYCRSWIEFASTRPSLTLEIRTKSSNLGALDGTVVSPNVILAWTMSPETVVRAHENGTTPLAQRIDSVRRAIDRGWRVRLCFDPVLRVPGWERLYEQLIHDVFRSIDPVRVHDVSVGVFRLNRDHLKIMQRQNGGSSLLHHPFVIDGDGATYARHQAMTEWMVGHLIRYLPKEKIHT
jgi:spore photoproduct lyase